MRMKWVDVKRNLNTVTVGGYSNAKTVSGAIADMGRYIAKYIDKSEGLAMVADKKELAASGCNLPCEYKKDGGFYIDIEDGIATRYIDDENVEYDENFTFYICCRIVVDTTDDNENDDNDEIEIEIFEPVNEVGTIQHLFECGLINDNTEIIIDNGSDYWFQDDILKYMKLHYKRFTYDPTENKIELTYEELPEC